MHPSGRRTFVAWGRVRATGKAWRYTLGRWQPGVFDLADAREQARAVLARGREQEPGAARRREKIAGTFGDLANSYLEDAAHHLRPGTLEEWRLLLEHPRLDTLRARRTTEITRGELIRLFDRIRDESVKQGGKGYSSNRTFEAVRRVFSWAVEKDLVAATPCIGVKKPVKELPRRRSYTDDELAAIIGSLDDSTMGDAIRLCLLTGVRLEAALGAPWTEVDVERAEWTIAGDRAGTKNGLPWCVPLVPMAVEMLERRRESNEGESPFVFPAGRGSQGTAWRSQRAVERFRRTSGVVDFRPHDFRRTLNTWLAGRAGGAEPLEVRDAILGHRPRGLEGTYNVHAYAAEKRAALERWAQHVERIMADEPGKVLPMVRA